jgi:3-oxocholest-4-en-26-oyl-CoA dehydrogenase alpha subunit
MTMDFSWGDAAERFRTEVREFLDRELTSEMEHRMYESGVADDAAFTRALAARHWIGPDWDHGDGTEPCDAYQVHVLTEELTRADAPIYLTATTMMVASLIRAAGSNELKAEILPKALRGETSIALGMTEPEAGSDVGAVQTKARLDGDQWVIDGQKMFTTNAHVADYVFLLARTDPNSTKHTGLSTFLVPLDQPGIEVQGVFTLSGERTNITYYSDVRVHDRYRIGEVNCGWATLMVALQDEHSAPFIPHLSRMIEATEQWARSTIGTDGRARITDDDVRMRLARAATSEYVGALLEARNTWMEAQHVIPVAEGPMAKLFSTESLIRHSESLAEVVGEDALRNRGDATAPSGGQINYSPRHAVGTAIYAGTSEIQRNIIAQYACGLPRS